MRSRSLIPIILAALSAFQTNALLTKRVTCPSGEQATNAECCELFPAVDFIQENLFDGGECGEAVHATLNLAFHDAIGFSIHGGKGGGADGSILEFNCVESAYQANEEIVDIIIAQFPVFEALPLTPGDFLHLAAAVGVSNCPGAPRLPFMFGRPTPLAPAPDLTIPEPTDDVTAILARFADAGFSPQEVIALLSAHSIGAAHVIDATIPGAPFDSTPSTFDTQFFLETLLKGTLFSGNGSQPGEVLAPLKGEIRLQSDFLLSQDARTACLWQSFVNNQQAMTTQFTAAMAKLQTLGQTSSELIDCSEVIPVPEPFAGPIKFPAGFSKANIQLACASSPFPTISTTAGAAPAIPPVNQL